MKFALVCVRLAAALFAGSAYADWVPAIGQGTSSCMMWNSAHRDGTQFVFHEWVLGFLSGAKWVRFENGHLTGADPELVWAWIDNYCQDHPLDQISAAIDKFVSTHSH